jgi:multidrug resistance efflux pump
MMSTTLAGVTDRQRVALEFERLQLDWMSARVELASLRGQLQVAESDVASNTPLHQNGLIPKERFDQLKVVRDSLAEQVTEQQRLVARLEPFLRTMASEDGQTAALSNRSALASAIAVEEAKLKLTEQQMTPVPIVAPISGVVSVVFRRAGETVVAGEPILRIVSPRPERLSGYLRQPLPFEPKVGMPVEIRSRAQSRQTAGSTIIAVGAGMEMLTPSLISALHLPPTPLPEPGLKIQIGIPDGFKVLPGEFVDVIAAP